VILGGGIWLDNGVLKGAPPTPVVDSCRIVENEILPLTLLRVPDRALEALSGSSGPRLFGERPGLNKEPLPFAVGGAGISISGPVAATIRNCTIESNTLTAYGFGFGFLGGAGISCQSTDLVRGTDIKIQNCDIIRNTVTPDFIGKGLRYEPAGGGGILLGWRDSARRFVSLDRQLRCERQHRGSGL